MGGNRKKEATAKQANDGTNERARDGQFAPLCTSTPGQVGHDTLLLLLLLLMLLRTGFFEEWFAQTVAAGNAEREKALRDCLHAFGGTPAATDKCLLWTRA